MKKHLVTFSAMMLAGCATTGVQVDPARVAEFKPGLTTRAEIEQAIGRPMIAQTLPDGKAVMTYVFAHAQVRPTSFIPIIGAFAGGSDVRSNSVTIMLDKNGRYESNTSTNMEMGSATGFAAGPYQTSVNQPR